MINGQLTWEITFDRARSMVAMEAQMRLAVNELGRQATCMALNSFDTNDYKINIEALK